MLEAQQHKNQDFLSRIATLQFHLREKPAPAEPCPEPCSQYLRRIAALQAQIYDQDYVDKIHSQELRQNIGSLAQSAQSVKSQLANLTVHEASQTRAVQRSLGSGVAAERNKVAESELLMQKDLEEGLSRAKQLSKQTVFKLGLKAEAQRRQIREEFNQLEVQLRASELQRSKRTQEAVSKMSREISLLQGRFQSLSRERRQAQQQLGKRVARLGARLREELGREEEERREGECLVVKLLEKACQRMQSNVQKMS